MNGLWKLPSSTNSARKKTKTNLLTGKKKCKLGKVLLNPRRISEGKKNKEEKWFCLSEFEYVQKKPVVSIGKY